MALQVITLLRGSITQRGLCPNSRLVWIKVSCFQDRIRHNSWTGLFHSRDFSKCGCEMWPGVSSAVLTRYPTIHSGCAGLMALITWHLMQIWGNVTWLWRVHQVFSFIHHSLNPSHGMYQWKSQGKVWTLLDKPLINLANCLDYLIIVGCCSKYNFFSLRLSYFHFFFCCCCWYLLLLVVERQHLGNTFEQFWVNKLTRTTKMLNLLGLRDSRLSNPDLGSRLVFMYTKTMPISI